MLAGVNLLHAVLLDGLLGYPELATVFAVPDILRRSSWAPRIARGDGVHEVGVAVGCGANAITEDGEACSGGAVEQEVEELLLLGLVRHVRDEIGALEGETEAEAIHFLKSAGEVDGDGGGLLAGTEGGCARGSSGADDGSRCCEECSGEAHLGWALGGEMVGVVTRIVVSRGEGDSLRFYT